MQLISWNVNGIRAVAKKEFFDQFDRFNPDIFCIQETKAQDEQVLETLAILEGYYLYSNSAEKKGYSGVAVLSKIKPLTISTGLGFVEHDSEGRVLMLEYEDFILVNVYVPNSGADLKRLGYRSEWDKAFGDYCFALRERKPVIITGDFNVAHKDIDLARPKENYNKTSGFTQVEIDGMDYLMSKGYKDSFRHLYPEKIQYSFWSVRFGARAKNVGWRIDYFLLDERLLDNLKEASIYDQELGSDHCPIGIELEF